MRPTRCQDGLIEIVNAKEICTTETIVTVRAKPSVSWFLRYLPVMLRL